MVGERLTDRIVDTVQHTVGGAEDQVVCQNSRVGLAVQLDTLVKEVVFDIVDQDVNTTFGVIR
ncbi:hypothetical protein D3C80_2051720 [compost metagenome]